MPLARTQTHSALTVALRHRFEGFLCGADDGGQVHHHQRQTAGQKTGLEAQRLTEHQHTHQAVDDAGDTGQRFVGELDDLDEPSVRGVFGQVDRRTYAQRQYDE